MNNIINNYEISKLSISHPNIFYFTIIILFLLSAFLTGKKTIDHKLLNFSHSTQLKGLAIFFVIFNHLFIHVSDSKPDVIFTGYAVCMFLILSGFGLSVSTGNEKLGLKSFIIKRIYRVMVPYWIITTVILLLDFIILDRVYPFNKSVLTFLGINIYKELAHIDYVRWFITFILLWYVIFFIGQNVLKKSKIPYAYIFISLILLPLNYYVFKVGWHAYLGFPIGCLFAIYYEEIIKIYKTKTKLVMGLSISGFIYSIVFNKILLSNPIISQAVYNIFPGILMKYIIEINSLILNICLIMLSGQLIKKGFESKLLIYFGRYSYELMLLHGMFLIKYNPILKNSNDAYNYIGFIALISIILVFSIIFSNFSKLFYIKTV